MKVVIGISEMRVCQHLESVLITHSLGSCVGVAIHDPVACVGGLIHCMLPLSRVDPDRARLRPMMYVDTGVLALLQAAFDRGATRKNLIARLAGGASVLDDEGVFRIGERNAAVAQRVLEKNGIALAGQDIGGRRARTLSLRMATGSVSVKSYGQEYEI